MPHSVDYQTLFSKAIRGDREATEQLLLPYAAQLRTRIGRGLPHDLHSIVEVDDVLQEVYIQVLHDLADCHATSPEVFVCWLLSIADHRLHHVVRTMQCQKRGGGVRRVRLRSQESEEASDGMRGHLADPQATPCRSAARREAVSAIHAAVDELPVGQREVVRLHELEGMTLAETAKSIRKSPAAVRGLAHRAKKKLCELMQSSSRWFDKK